MVHSRIKFEKSHEVIKTICVSKGMAVVCVNSDGIVLTMPHTLEKIEFSKDDEFNSKIIEIYSNPTYGLHRFAFVITGYICIGRGITIMSERFMIDYGILSHYSNKNEASQLAGRLKGNIKGFANYNRERPPVIFTKEDFNIVAIEWESKSRALAQLAFEKEQNGQPTIISKSEFNTCDEDYDYVVHAQLFASFEQAKIFLVSKEREMNGKVKASRKV